jgi:hypothetical protein
VGSAVPISVNGADEDVVAAVVDVVRSLIAVSGNRLYTIGSRVEPSLLGGPPLLAKSS